MAGFPPRPRGIEQRSNLIDLIVPLHLSLLLSHYNAINQDKDLIPNP